VRWCKPQKEDKQLAWLWFGVDVSAVLLRPFWLAVAPMLPPCPFRALTGVPCPSCGTTRAAISLLHGDVIASLADNPLASLAGIAFVVGGALVPLWISLGGKLPALPRPLPLWLRMTAVAVLIANWAWVIVH
jgi:hypothetical protein